MKNKKSLIAIAVVAFLLVLLAATCPGQKDHTDIIKSAFSEGLQQQSTDDFSKAFSALFASRLVESFLDSHMKVHNYVLFSTGELAVEGESGTLTFGILNHVFLLKEDELKEAMNK